MGKIRIAVLRGGPSGQSILQNLSQNYHAVDILIDKKGVWHHNGTPVLPIDILKHVDAVVVALHGQYEEYGTVQNILETFGIPYTGSDSLGSALGMNKISSKKIFKTHGIKSPYHELADIPGSIEEQAVKIFKSFPLPAVIKPISSGSSVGVSIVRNLEELENGLRKAYQYGDKVLIEEYIQGKEATCGVIDDFRGHEIYPLIPVEICSDNSHICPGNFSQEEKKIIQEMSVLAHKILNLRHYSRSDFIVHPRRGVYMLEVNTLPELTEESLLPKSLTAIGCSLSDFLDHIIKLALRR
ncbi:MAG: ATP-grasp domain-containing protein [Patescibacteria group bacterium]|nr:ATP-grasp domain-containing protein [Patescibacteria group bacterium]